MDAAVRRTLRMLARTRTKTELAALFAAIRATSDKTLLEAATAPPRTPGEPDFARRIADRLSPILGPAEEKAGMLVDSLAEIAGPTDIRPAGLLPTIRRLVARYGEAAVMEAAERLMQRLAAWGSTRERVT